MNIICDPGPQSSTGIFLAIDNNKLYGSKLIVFSFMPKFIRIVKIMLHEDVL